MPTPLEGPSGPDPLFSVNPLEGTENAPPAAPPSGPLDTLSVSNSSGPLNMSLYSIELPQPKVGLLAFLKLLGDMKLDHRYASADTQAEILAVNRDFFLGLAQDFANIGALREAVENYFDEWNAFADEQNTYIDSLNAGIDGYNSTLIEANNRIAQLNAAIAAFNAVDPDDPDFPAAQGIFNDAVNDFNAYVTQSANPSLSHYETVRQQYNLNTANLQNDIDAYNEEVEAINQATGLELDPVVINAPTAPTAGISELDLATGLGHPNIPPYPTITAPALPIQSNVPNVSGNVDAIILPAVEKQVAALKLLQVIFQNISDYNAFLAFVLKTGSRLSPAAITAYTADTERATLDSAGQTEGQGGSVSMASSVMGLSSPFLEGAVAASLYTADLQKFDQQVVQNFIDQINALNAAALSITGQRAAFLALENAGPAIETLSPDDAATNTLVVALFAEALLDIIQNSAETLRPAIESLADETLNVPPAQLDAFVDDILAAQNASLALNAALALGIATGEPAFVGNLFSTIPSFGEINAQLALQPLPTVYQTLSDSANQLVIKASLNQDITDAQTLNQAVNQAIAQSTETTSAQEFSATLEKNLLAANLTPLQASQLSGQALEVLQALTTARTAPTASTTADLATALSGQIAQILSPLGPDIANQIATRVANTIYNPTDPNNTITRHLQAYADTYAKTDEAREQVINELLGFVPPAEMQVVKPSVVLLQLLDPAYNISKSVMTGVMYDRTMPTNFKYPTEIPI